MSNHETSGIYSFGALSLLATGNPDYADRVRDEAHALLPDAATRAQMMSDQRDATYYDFRMSTPALLVYTLPLRHLHITGRAPDTTRWLTSEEIQAAAAADDYLPAARTILWNDLSGVDRDLLYPAIRAAAASPLGFTRTNLQWIYPMLTENEMRELAGAVVDSVLEFAPADRMFAYGVRQSGADLLEKFHIADAPGISLPANSTVLRVSAYDHAMGDSIFTWRKVHGAGEVTFTPNGTAESKDTVIGFDGVPGRYLFEVNPSSFPRSLVRPNGSFRGLAQKANSSQQHCTYFNRKTCAPGLSSYCSSPRPAAPHVCAGPKAPVA